MNTVTILVLTVAATLAAPDAADVDLTEAYWESQRHDS